MNRNIINHHRRSIRLPCGNAVAIGCDGVCWAGALIIIGALVAAVQLITK